MSRPEEWTYDPAETSQRDQIRGLIGDIDEKRPLLDDRTVSIHLTRKGNIRSAAISLCQALEARFAQYTESRSGEIITDKNSVAAKYRGIARRLMSRQKGWAVLTKAEHQDRDGDTDALHTVVKRGFTDHADASTTAYPREDT